MNDMRMAQIIAFGVAVFLTIGVSVKADGFPPSSYENPVVAGEQGPGGAGPLKPTDVTDQKTAGGFLAPKPNSLEQADEEAKAAAVGHYARSRSLLIAAVREFDDGYKIAKPDAILNSKVWRESIISRAEELEKILAPQPRITKSGVRFNPDNRLLKTEAKGK